MSEIEPQKESKAVRKWRRIGEFSEDLPPLQNRRWTDRARVSVKEKPSLVTSDDPASVRMAQWRVRLGKERTSRAERLRDALQFHADALTRHERLDPVRVETVLREGFEYGRYTQFSNARARHRTFLEALQGKPKWDIRTVYADYDPRVRLGVSHGAEVTKGVYGLPSRQVMPVLFGTLVHEIGHHKVRSRQFEEKQRKEKVRDQLLTGARAEWFFVGSQFREETEVRSFTDRYAWKPVQRWSGLASFLTYKKNVALENLGTRKRRRRKK
jgi:hypothetical protein